MHRGGRYIFNLVEFYDSDIRPLSASNLLEVMNKDSNLIALQLNLKVHVVETWSLWEGRI